MAGPTIARNYADVSNLITSHQNAIFEVNGDGSIRTQSLKEKIGNLGLRITGKFTATKAEKDAKVAQAILGLYQKTNPTSNLPYFDPKNNKDYARFFNPQSLQKRSTKNEIKGKTGSNFVAAVNKNNTEVLSTVPAQKAFFSGISVTLERLASEPQYKSDAEALEGLSYSTREAGRNIKSDSQGDERLKTLLDDLKQVGLQLGKGPLKIYDLSKGFAAWGKENGIE